MGDRDAFYHEGSRTLQDRFQSRRIADRLEAVTLHRRFSDHDRVLIERASMFFLATADAAGRPDVSYKGGLPGFVQVLGDHELAFPHYDGNGMFRSLGNILVNPQVGLLFIRFDRPERLRIGGVATISDDAELLARWEGAQAAVRVDAEHVFPNCPRYIHRMHATEHSEYVPRAGHVPPVPDWKRAPEFRDALPPQD